MLSLTKEGIVAQFLPEAKDFWVSLSQVNELVRLPTCDKQVAFLYLNAVNPTSL